MRRFAALLLLATALPASAEVVVNTSRGIVVGHDGVIELYDERARRIWSAPGLTQVTKIVVGPDRVAALDAWSDQIRIVSLADGSGETISTKETPIDGVFSQGAFYVLCRDGRVVQRFGRGTRAETAVAADSVSIRAGGEKLYVYSRLEGQLQEIVEGAVKSTLSVGRFAADMEVEGGTAYLVFPLDAKIAFVDLDKMEILDRLRAGAVPMDVEVTRSSNALSATTLAVADVSAKRLRTIEGSQSVARAAGRGFLRGLLGLGTFQPRTAAFPTGIDRVAASAEVTLAFDSATGTLYRSRGKRSIRLAEGVAPQAFAIAGTRVAIWHSGDLRFVE